MFKETLDKLSINSKEAVIDGTFNNLDAFKDYLHIDRKVEKVLEKMVLNSIESKISKLIMISGNVGDGKSHMLAKLFQRLPEQMNQVEVRNDATESNFLSKSWIEELSDFLAPFSDSEIEKNDNKRVKIVAINLGVLSRFIQEKGDDFKLLKSFVIDKGIIEHLNYNNAYNDNSYFQFVNLADFKLFELTENTIHSSIIRGILDKITAHSNNNPIYNAFIQYYLNHPYQGNCILRNNFLQLSKGEVKDSLTSIIVYILIKDKLILSIRDLLNFVYDLLVPFAYQALSSDQIKIRKDYLDQNFIIENNLAYKLFESSKRSPLLTCISKVDPLTIREEFIDRIIFNLNSTQNPETVFDEHGIEMPKGLQTVIDETYLRNKVIKTFVRALFLQKSPVFNNSLHNFQTFCQYLFHYYTGNKIGLQSLYIDVNEAIKRWNGSSKVNDEVNIPIGAHQIEYNVTQKISFRPIIKVIDNKQDILNELDYTIPITLEAKDKEYTFVLDLELYSLLLKVRNGYSPNKKDKEDHIDFQNFVNLLINASLSNNDGLNFERINGNQIDRYELSIDMFGNYTFKKA
ncbi:DNA phosphorothioation-dependent restriction protein DptF [Sphingobacterium zeae]|uniref:DNA phosphorothioation-dependent restriction protein DptF n=1 Tax=Sphingobacterium zeae TaxID=1776859 RepID=UPI00361D58BD